jgi:hypothetical protein
MRIAGNAGLRPATGPGVDDRWSALERLLALALVFAVSVRIYVVSAITPGVVLAVLLAPLLIFALRRYRLAVALLAVAGLALVSGLVLAAFAGADYRIDSGNQLYSITFYIGVFVSIAALLWARTKVDTGTIALVFGVGSLISAVLGEGIGSGNPWKFALAVPVAMVVLAGAVLTRSRVLQIMMLILLAGVSVIFDSRSYMATFLLAAVLLIWQLKPQRITRRGSAIRTAVLLAAVGGAVYLLGTELLVGGVLGTEAQQRTVDQLETSGNLILGGRPELAAFLALLAYRPLGFGFGVLLDLGTVNVAKAGMASAGYDPENGYVERFMFGSGVELHSVTGDLWSMTGIAGLALVIMIAVVVVITVIRRVADGTADGLFLFLACWTGWNLLFSPFLSAAPSLILLLALSLAPRAPESEEPSRSRTPSSRRGSAD